MRIIYIPIDERPCNTEIVKRIANSTPEIKLILPPNEFFGNKKSPAHTEELWEWLNVEAKNCHALILSIDMLIYGGLIPSRLHYLSEDTGMRWLNRLRSFHRNHANLPIYAFNLIMRTPSYSSSDEEPDYYEDWGREIFLNSYLHNKSKHEDLSQKELIQLHDVQLRLPEKYVEDYETRREYNLHINESMLELTNEGVFTFLAIPQDDSSEYGYTAKDQRVILSKRESLHLYEKVLIYPGADEAGATLLARVYNDLKDCCPKIFPIWSSIHGPQITPMYEDRTFEESMKFHIRAAGCLLVDDANSADLILAYNTPGLVMQESCDQYNKDATYTSFRDMKEFVSQMKRYILHGRKIIVADSAYANGGDFDLITLMDEEGILDKIVSYKGWNTNCNTLGTTLSQGVIGQNGYSERLQENIIYHLLDDYFYQAEIRKELTTKFLPNHNLSYFDLKNKADLVNKERDRRMICYFTEKIKNSFPQINIEELYTYAPWNRMFECGVRLKVKFLR
ncbi:DUF4127 family protein [Virgibacillus salexigens]|uniref:DUF4127 family protein n=1 Tax=Virgibacillus salexigens TaxID=61016 RepID=UPI00190D8A4B|nr:DUF4127 family protein [Virgibacillus salexigens]